MKARGGVQGLVIVMVMGLAIVASAGAAEPERSLTALESRVRTGTPVEVVDPQGYVLRGTLVRADDEGVVVTVHGSGEGRRVASRDITSVIRYGDSLRNGTLIGAGVGMLGVVGVWTDDSTVTCSSDGCRTAWSAIVLGSYVGIGALIDHLIKGREVVYRAPNPRVSWSVAPQPARRGAGLQVALRF